MRNIKYIVVHCTATAQTAKVSAILNYWRSQLGWKNPGYHILIDAAGVQHELLTVDKVANGVLGYNSQSVHVGYIGGVDGLGNPQDNRTMEQKAALVQVLKHWRRLYPNATIQGHRDFPRVKKACPSFDARLKYAHL